MESPAERDKKAYKRAYYEKHKEQQSEYHKAYYERNREKILEQAKKYQMEKNGGPKKRGRPSKYETKKPVYVDDVQADPTPTVEIQETV